MKMKTKGTDKKLIIGISSRALFDLSESHSIFEDKGEEAFSQYQIDHENEVLKPGMAFSLVKKLLHLNTLLDKPLIEIVLISRNSADTGLRIFNSIQHYKLKIERAVFTRGKSPYQYLSAFGASLFLSADRNDVCQALQAGCAAAAILPGKAFQSETEELRIAFDGDAVLFSDEAEKIYQAEGLLAFQTAEQKAASTPLPGGPFKNFLAALHALQKLFPAQDCPIRTALVTARSAPSHERVIRTLRAWDIRVDEALFLGGLDKGKFLKSFGADFFFDDQKAFCESASAYTAAAHVPYGVKNN